MKYLYTLLFFAVTTINMYAQTPDKISYQAIIRANDNSLVTNAVVSVRILIRQTTTTGAVVYQESHTKTTNANGLVSLEIGTGTTAIGNFSQIAWSQGPYFIETQVDITGGSNYNIIGISQLLSVPYALHAKTAERIVGGGASTTPYKASIRSLTSSRNINTADIYNTIACTVSSTLTIATGFSDMQIGDTINLEAHNGAALTIRAASGVTLNYTNAGSASFISDTGNVRFGLLRKSGENAYIISGQ
ncbi:hypothetical protein [Confluentibacter sediminis]|uniref:hypothetical protein n=1 Tax=Confluentibacter sediminis TaxID=2219045 RepID=UPI0013A6CFEC|nr:hypothetical protein [Confluentibacter sediminis]